MYGIGEATIQLIKDGADVQGAPDQGYLKRALADQARIVTEKVSAIFLPANTMSSRPECCPYKPEVATGCVIWVM